MEKNIRLKWDLSYWSSNLCVSQAVSFCIYEILQGGKTLEDFSDPGLIPYIPTSSTLENTVLNVGLYLARGRPNFEEVIISLKIKSMCSLRRKLLCIEYLCTWHCTKDFIYDTWNITDPLNQFLELAKGICISNIYTKWLIKHTQVWKTNGLRSVSFQTVNDNLLVESIRVHCT